MTFLPFLQNIFIRREAFADGVADLTEMIF
jgi:hypothetical protein